MVVRLCLPLGGSPWAQPHGLGEQDGCPDPQEKGDPTCGTDPAWPSGAAPPSGEWP